MRKLMVVDDEEIIRDIVQDIVDTNCRDVVVETACCGEEALEKLQRSEYDLIFLDMKMRESDGLDTYRRIHALNPGQKVFIITGYLDEERNRQAMEEGACGTIYKPFKVDEIIGIIEQHTEPGRAAGKGQGG